MVDLQTAGDPSSLNVRKGVSATGGAVAAAGYAAISAGDVDSDVTVAVANQRLASETAYYLHVAAEDASSPPNLGASASAASPSSTPDVTPPRRGAVHRFRRDQRGGRGEFRPDRGAVEPGSVYYVVVEKGDAPAITAADVRNLRGGAIGDARSSSACGAFGVRAADASVTVTVATNNRRVVRRFRRA